MVIERRRDLPAGAVAALGPMAELGGAFNPSDIQAVGEAQPPRRRFVSAEGLGCDLSATYEQGGRSYSRATAHLRWLHGRWAIVSR